MPSPCPRALLLLALLPLLPGCYTLACVPTFTTIQAPDRHKFVRVEIWELEPGWAETSFLKASLVSIVAYPLDVIASSICAVGAIADPNLAIRWGPAGALAGIALPGVTLVPSRFKRSAIGQVWISPVQLDELLDAIRDGRAEEGLAKVKDLWSPHVISVEFVEIGDVGPGGFIPDRSR